MLLQAEKAQAEISKFHANVVAPFFPGGTVLFRDYQLDDNHFIASALVKDSSLGAGCADIAIQLDHSTHGWLSHEAGCIERGNPDYSENPQFILFVDVPSDCSEEQFTRLLESIRELECKGTLRTLPQATSTEVLVDIGCTSEYLFTITESIAELGS